MDWEQLYEMQNKLDTYIINTHQLAERDLFDERILALLVELGELANETRCFKFWSHKKANERDVILEEYVDNIHFLLSLGLTKNYRPNEASLVEEESDLTKQFMATFTACIAFKNNQTESLYQAMFAQMIQLGRALGFTESDIKKAYYDKNEENFRRQDEGY